MTDIPETDLIKIAEREVIERAKAWATEINEGVESKWERHRLRDNLLAAVALLESREGWGGKDE